MELPLELLHDFLDHITFEALNTFARLCRYSASLVKRDAEKLANRFVIGYTLPNGTLHGVKITPGYWEEFTILRFGNSIAYGFVGSRSSIYIGDSFKVSVEKRATDKYFEYRGSEGVYGIYYGLITSPMIRQIIKNLFEYLAAKLPGVNLELFFIGIWERRVEIGPRVFIIKN
nr:hypothetical protein K-LCC10_0268 [Kaumoebavirus]